MSDAAPHAQRRPVALIILDGWGLADAGPGNAVALANTPIFDALWEQHPHTTLTASGEAVGLPAGQIGNSEVGHLNLGAGRIVHQDLARINHAIVDGTFAANAVLSRTLRNSQSNSRQGSTLHVLGLASHGGVHSQIAHIQALVEAAAEIGVARIAVHAFTDGRDVSPDASLADIPQLEAWLAEVSSTHGVDARIATVIGRYWAMDRDKRWDRTRRAWSLLVHGEGAAAATATAAVQASHDAGITDEFIEPHVIVEGDQWRIRDGDIVVYANFRPDRTRQLCHALVDASFSGFVRSNTPNVHLVTMTRYDDILDVPVIFDARTVDDTLADVLERNDIAQLHVAETEKYAHVTYFFNGGVEHAHEHEARLLVDSPRDVATYDEKPQMSANAACDAFCAGMSEPTFAFGIINFANPDMVGHTGVIAAAVTAVETVDRCLGRVVDTIHARGGACIITADHGNAETMLTADGRPHTAHTTNPVPFIVTTALDHPLNGSFSLRDGGILGNVAPTVLDLLQIPAAAAMTEGSLISR